MLANGLTTVADMGTSSEDWNVMRRAGDAGLLNVRILSYASGIDHLLATAGTRPTPWLYDGRLRMIGVKLYLDGALGSRGAWLKQPYRDSPQHRGLPLVSDTVLKNLMSRAAMDNFFPFSRKKESSPDQAGARFLAKAGLSGRGSLDFFRKLQNQEYRLAIPQDDGYGRTHPLTGDRMAALEQIYKNSPNWDKPVDPVLEARFERIKAKLLGFTQDPPRTMQVYPESDQSVPAHYARAYAWHRGAYPDRAEKEVAALIAKDPHDPYFLELQGQILLESGRPAEAIPPLREAVRRSGGQPMIAVMLGHALIATEDKQHFGEAKQILRAAVNRDNDNPFAWYQLGIIYDREGDQSRAALATAERFNLIGNARGALTNARVAMNGLSRGTPDWIRAQDIAMVSENEVQKDKKRR